MANFLNTVAQHWFDWQFAMLWQTVVLIGIIWTVDVVIRKWAHPQVRYALWMLVLVKLLIPPTWTSPASVTSHIPNVAIRAATVMERANGHEAVTAMEPANDTIPDSTNAATGRERIAANKASTTTPNRDATVMERADVTEPVNVIDPISAGLASPDVSRHSIAATEKQTTGGSQLSLSWQVYAMFTWLAGMAVLTLWLLMRLSALRREHIDSCSVIPAKAGTLSNQSKMNLPERFYHQLEAVAAKLNLKKLPRVILTDKVACPAVFGIFRPILLMPAAKFKTMSTQDTEHVLLHELAHIKRGDLLVHAVYMLTQIVYWFNPLLWMIRRTLQNLRELCCDATVAKLLREDTVHYRQTLLETARQLLAEPVDPGLGLLGLFENSNWLVTRLQWLEKNTWKNRPLRIATIIALVTVMTACVLPMANRPKKIATEDTENKEFIKTLDNSVTVELLGVCKHPIEGQSWWKPDGSPLEEAPFDCQEGDRVYARGEEQAYEFAVRYSNIPEEMDSIFYAEPSTSSLGGTLSSDVKKNGKSLQTCQNGKLISTVSKLATVFDKKRKTCDIKMAIANGPWETNFESIKSKTGGSWGTSSQGRCEGGAIFGKPSEEDRKTWVTITHTIDPKVYNIMVVAVHQDGSILKPVRSSGNSVTDATQLTLCFDIPLEYIMAFQVQTRKYEWFTFKDITLRPKDDNRFKVTGTVTDAETGQPIAGVKVGDNKEYNDGKFFTVTDSNGHYEYKTWYEEHFVVAEASGYKAEREILLTKLLGSEKEKVINFELTKNSDLSRAESSELERNSYAAKLPNDVTVELVGVCEYPSVDNQWRTPNGELLNRPYKKLKTTYIETDYKPYELLFRVIGQHEMFTQVELNDSVKGHFGISPLNREAKGIELSGSDNCYAVVISCEQGRDNCDIEVGLWTGDWQTKASSDGDEMIMGEDREYAFSKPISKPDGSIGIVLSHDPPEGKMDQRLVAITNDGNLHKSSFEKRTSTARLEQYQVEFKDISLDDIKEFQFQIRPFNWITFKNVSLRPGVKMQVEVAIDDGQSTKDGEAEALNGSTQNSAVPYNTVIERTLHFRDVFDIDLFDFRTNAVFEVPGKLKFWDYPKWYAEHGIDVICILTKRGPTLSGDGHVGGSFGNYGGNLCKFVPTNLGMDSVAKNLELAWQSGESVETIDHGGWDNLPARFFFKTRDGDTGILEITTIDETEKSITFKYKLFETEPVSQANQTSDIWDKIDKDGAEKLMAEYVQALVSNDVAAIQQITASATPESQQLRVSMNEAEKLKDARVGAGSYVKAEHTVLLVSSGSLKRIDGLQYSLRAVMTLEDNVWTLKHARWYRTFDIQTPKTVLNSYALEGIAGLEKFATEMMIQMLEKAQMKLFKEMTPALEASRDLYTGPVFDGQKVSIAQEDIAPVAAAFVEALRTDDKAGIDARSPSTLRKKLYRLPDACQMANLRIDEIYANDSFAIVVTDGVIRRDGQPHQLGISFVVYPHGKWVFSDIDWLTPETQLTYIESFKKNFPDFKKIFLRPGEKTQAEIETEKDLDSNSQVRQFNSFVPFEITRQGFLENDWIEITQILSSTYLLKVGQTYTIKGRYKLSSRENAMLHIYATNGETQSDQGPVVSRGTGEFTRTFTYLKEGWLHLSFYPAEGGGSFGNLYFAQRGSNQQVPDMSTITSKISASNTDDQHYQQWLDKISSLDDHKRAAFVVVPQLLEEPPDFALRVALAAWPNISSYKARQGVLKAFHFAKHPHTLAVLDMGVHDPHGAVVSYALTYVAEYSGVKFPGFGDEYIQWYEENKNKPLDQLREEKKTKHHPHLDQTLEKMIAQFKGGAKRTDLWDDAGTLGDAQYAYAIPAMIGMIDADNSYDTIYGVGYFGLSRITGVEYSPFHDGAWWKRWWKKNKSSYPQQVQNIPIPELPKTAHGYSFTPYPEDIDTPDGMIRWMTIHYHDLLEGYPDWSSAAEEFTRWQGPRAIPCLIAAIDAAEGKLTYDIGYHGLDGLTGVPYEESHDAAWWKNWWQKNKSRYPKEVQALDIEKIKQQYLRPGEETQVEAAIDEGQSKGGKLLLGPKGTGYFNRDAAIQIGRIVIKVTQFIEVTNMGSDTIEINSDTVKKLMLGPNGTGYLDRNDAIKIGDAMIKVDKRIEVSNTGSDIIEIVKIKNQSSASAPSASEEKSDIPLTQKPIERIEFKKDMKLTDACRMLSKFYKVNIIPSQAIHKSRATIPVTNLYDVTFEETLKAICGSSYTYVIQGDFVYVYTKEESAAIRVENLKSAQTILKNIEEIYSVALGAFGENDLDLVITTMESGLPRLDKLEQVCSSVDINTSDFATQYRQVIKLIKNEEHQKAKQLFDLLGDIGHNLEGKIKQDIERDALYYAHSLAATAPPPHLSRIEDIPDWKTISESYEIDPQVDTQGATNATDYGMISFGNAYEKDGAAFIEITDTIDRDHYEVRFVAVSKDDRVVLRNGGSSGGFENITRTTARFDISLQKVKYFRLQIRSAKVQNEQD